MLQHAPHANVFDGMLLNPMWTTQFDFLKYHAFFINFLDLIIAMELQLDRNVLLRDVNDYISCFLCGGYLVEATTIVDCLHTFCKSCLLRRLLLKEHNCPKCGNLIHHSHPMQHIGK